MTTTKASGWKTMVAIVAVITAAIGVGMGPKLEQRDARARAALAATSPRRVRVAEVRPGDASIDVTLPGTATRAPLPSEITFTHRESLPL